MKRRVLATAAVVVLTGLAVVVFGPLGGERRPQPPAGPYMAAAVPSGWTVAQIRDAVRTARASITNARVSYSVENLKGPGPYQLPSDLTDMRVHWLGERQAVERTRYKDDSRAESNWSNTIAFDGEKTTVVISPSSLQGQAVAVIKPGLDASSFQSGQGYYPLAAYGMYQSQIESFVNESGPDGTARITETTMDGLDVVLYEFDPSAAAVTRGTGWGVRIAFAKDRSWLPVYYEMWPEGEAAKSSGGQIRHQRALREVASGQWLPMKVELWDGHGSGIMPPTLGSRLIVNEIALGEADEALVAKPYGVPVTVRDEIAQAAYRLDGQGQRTELEWEVR